ncbi:hypothetical protein [Flavobacterium sp.]|uniref:hypothetical protein n=1 Tax=Flavobacterium sp. TaxID=239 RepID=UPI00261A5ED4|nr:hypothetical protein [Flavobacterium sp.]
MKLFFFSFLITVFSSYSQIKTEEEKFLLNYVKNEIRTRIIYTDKIKPDFVIESIVYDLNHLKELLRDENWADKKLPEKIIFTKEECKQALNEILTNNENSYIENKLPRMRYISSKDLSKRKKYINYWSFSKPVFLRKNSICIFYSGNLDGGSFNIYIKSNESWTYFSSLIEWVR